MEQRTDVGTAIDIQLVLYVLDPTVIVVTPSVERIPIADDVWLRPVGTDRSGGPGSPVVLTLALEFSLELPAAEVAEPVWAYLRARRGGRGVVTARLVRRWAEPGAETADGPPVMERHELWFAIPLGAGRAGRRQVDAFFAEVLSA